MTEVTTISPADAAQRLERATADYLAISRGGHLYASVEEHERAEDQAWERLQEARDVALEAGVAV